MNQVNRKIALCFVQMRSGEGDDKDKTFTKDELETAINAAKEAAVTELKGKNTELLGELKGLKTSLKKFDGVDVDGLKLLQEKIAGDEILSLLADGKSAEALEKHTERLTVTHAAKIDTMNTELETLKNSGLKNVEVINKLLIDGGSQSAFIEAKGLSTAIDDISLRARQVWKVEDGVLVARDSENEMLKGENGPLTMKEWAEKLKETAPHLFPVSETGGTQGGKGGKPGEGTFEAQILEAVKNGDFGKQRELSKKLREQKTGRN